MRHGRQEEREEQSGRRGERVPRKCWVSCCPPPPGEDFAPDGGGESIQIKLPGLGQTAQHLGKQGAQGQGEIVGCTPQPACLPARLPACPPTFAAAAVC